MKMLSRIKKAMRTRGTLLGRDGVKLAAATTFVAGLLFGIYCLIGGPAEQIDYAAAAARAAELQRQEALALQARRTGTILFVTYTKLCEQHRFDNTTGYTVGIDQVDCDEALRAETKAAADGSQAKNMKGMLASFKK